MSESSKSKCPPPYAKIMNAVIDQVLSVWNSASIPALSVKRCQDMIKSHHDRYNDMKKNYSRDKDRSSFKEKLETFREFSDKLFDIAFCKCSSKCTCPRELKIPEAEISFLLDQRSRRKMFIGKVDPKMTGRLMKTNERKQKNVYFQN